MKDHVAYRGGLIARTIWQIESDLAEPLTLGTLAKALGVSRFHLNRAFSFATGMPVMAYVRGRRLSLAANALQRTEHSITDIAFASGYESHEGFARAFRSYFGASPREYRADPSPYIHLKQESLPMPEPKQMPSVTPQIVEFEGLRVVGTNKTYTFEERGGIPGQFQEFFSGYGDLSRGRPTFGVCHNFNEGAFDFLTGALAQAGAHDLHEMTLPAGTYAVFKIEGDVTAIAPTWDAIMSDWAAGQEFEIADGPEFEYYEPDYDPGTPGGVSIYIPVRKKT